METANIYAIVGLTITAYSILAFVHILLHAKQPQAALGWAIAVLTIPFLGSTIYFLFGVRRVDSRAAVLLYNASQRRKINIYEEHENIFYINDEEKKQEDSLLADLQKENQSLHTIFVNSKILDLPTISHIRPLFNGDMAYPQMIKAINEAEHEVYLASYIFSGEEVGASFADALLDAHKRGVEVRVLIDGLSNFIEKDASLKMLKEAKVKVAEFLPPKLFPPQFSINLRNHKKILICDSKAFTGGMNISDEHLINGPHLDTRKEKVQDIHFLCEGLVVARLREVFLLDWAFVTNEDKAPIMPKLNATGNMLTHVLVDGLGSHQTPILKQFYDVISCAKKSILIFSPYFLPPNELKSALYAAVSRGVEVKVVLPERSNHFYIDWACAHTLGEFLENKVEIYLQAPPFAHTKLMLIDDLYTCLGSTNLDSRSLALNFEVNIEVYSKDLHAELTTYAHSILKRSKRYTRKEHKKIPLLKRLRNASTWLLSPYL